MGGEATMVEILASVDQGTQSSRVTLYDNKLRSLASVSREHKQFIPEAGWVEHDAAEILDAVSGLLERAVAQVTTSTADASSGPRTISIRGVGITNQRETTVAWDRQTGKPLYNAIVWLDTRTKSIVDALVAKHGSADAFRAVTGLPIATYFSATKIRWMMDNVPAVKDAVARGNCYFGTIDAWLIWNLTGGPRGGVFVTDITNASRTLLMDIRTCAWSSQMLEVFGVPLECLPTIRSSAELYGKINTPKAPALRDAPICGCAGDQQAACVGHGLFDVGEVKCTYGTGAFILINCGESPVVSNCGLLTTPCYKLGANAPVVYALEGSIAIAGAAVSWLRDSLQLIESPQETEQLIESVNNTDGVYFVPAFSGLFAPRWRPDARGCIIGITQHTRKAHIVRALMESIGFQLNELVTSMLTDMDMKELKIVHVDGGMTRNTAFLQLTSNLCGCPVERPSNIEVTALGAAIAAGFGCGMFTSLDETRALLACEATTLKPLISASERQRKLGRYNKAVERSLNWAT